MGNRAEAGILENVQIASPCGVSWTAMDGDDRVRFCKECKLHVFNLSAMTRSEAERIVKQAEGRLCVRYFQRLDGTVMTRDCPVGRGFVVRRMRGVAKFVAAAVMLVGCCIAWADDGRWGLWRGMLREIRPFRRYSPRMGMICVPSGLSNLSQVTAGPAVGASAPLARSGR